MIRKHFRSAAVFLSIFLPMSSLAIIPNREYRILPQQAGLIYKELAVTTDDGYGIHTWFYPAQAMSSHDASSTEPLPYTVSYSERRTTIIICNGDAGNMSYYQIFMAKNYTAAGYNVVTFDWRGFGKSDDFPMDPAYLCYTEMLYDYNAVIDAVASQKEVDASNIYLLGWSTGAYLSMIAAHDNPLIKGCILRGTPSSFEDAIPILKEVKHKTERQLVVPDNFPAGAMPAYIAPTFDKHIMLVVGTEDNRTPPWMTKKIYDALPDKAVKKIWIAPDAGHGGTDAPEFKYPKTFFRKTDRFIRKSSRKTIRTCPV